MNQPNQPNQQPQGAAADPNDLQQKQADIGQATSAPAGSLASYETVPTDEGVSRGGEIHNYTRVQDS